MSDVPIVCTGKPQTPTVESTYPYLFNQNVMPTGAEQGYRWENGIWVDNSFGSVTEYRNNLQNSLGVNASVAEGTQQARQEMASYGNNPDNYYYWQSGNKIVPIPMWAWKLQGSTPESADAIRNAKAGASIPVNSTGASSAEEIRRTTPGDTSALPGSVSAPSIPQATTWGTGEQYRGIFSAEQIAQINTSLGVTKQAADEFFKSPSNQKVQSVDIPNGTVYTKPVNFDWNATGAPAQTPVPVYGQKDTLGDMNPIQSALFDAGSALGIHKGAATYWAGKDVEKSADIATKKYQQYSDAGLIQDGKFIGTPDQFTDLNVAGTNYQRAAAKQEGLDSYIPLATAGIFAIPTVVKGAGDVVSKLIEDSSGAAYSFAAGLPGPLAGHANAAIGLGSAFVSTAPFVMSVPYGAQWAITNPSGVLPKATEIGMGMADSMWTREQTNPGAAIGTFTGMWLGGKAMGYAGGKAIDYSPVGVGVAKITASSGAESTVFAAYTKGIFTPVKDANVRAWVGFGAKSEAQMLVGTTKFGFAPDGITFRSGEVPTFKSQAEVVTEFNKAAGQEATFMHGTNSPSFVQSVIRDGSFVVDTPTEGAMLFARPGEVYTRFINTWGKPGSDAAIIRITEAPRSVAEATAHGGTITDPILPEGLYPGTKPLAGWTTSATGRYYGLQQEFVVPKGSKMSLTDIGYVEAGGARIPVLDFKIGESTLVDKINVGAKKIQTRAANIEMPEYGWGKPTEFLKGQNIKMWNPMEEVPSQQWTPSQKLVMYDYIRRVAREEGADAGVNAVSAGIDAIPALRKTKFVQREPVGEVIVGKDLSADAISKIFAGREAMGKDVVGGGSTTIRANLGKGFFDESLIGDIDAWARGNKVEQLWSNEMDIIRNEVPEVEGAKGTFIDLKIGKEAQGKFPVGAITKPGAPKPIVEIHSIEQFPHVEKPANIATLETVGGHKTTGLSTEYLGVRKASAIFDKQYLTQVPGGKLEMQINPREVKHGVGASAITKEAASLWYGRDSEITGMTPDYAKGAALEKYSGAMDELLSRTTGKELAEVKKYEAGIEQNPLDLPVTKKAKAIAYARSGKAAGQIFGVDMGLPTGSYKSLAYPSPSRTTKVSGIASSVIGAGIGASEYSAAPQQPQYTQQLAYPYVSNKAAPAGSQYPVANHWSRPEYPAPVRSEVGTVYPSGGTVYPSGGTVYPTPSQYPTTYNGGGTPRYTASGGGNDNQYPTTTQIPNQYPTTTNIPNRNTVITHWTTPTKTTPFITIPVTRPLPNQDEQTTWFKPKKRHQKGKRFAEVFSFDKYKGMPVPGRLYIKDFRSIAGGKGKRFEEVFSMAMHPLPLPKNMPIPRKPTTRRVRRKP